MTILTDYRTKVNIRGATPRQRTVNYRVNDYNETFMRAPEYEQVKLTLTDEEDSSLYDIWLYSNSSYKELVNMKTVIFAPGTPEEVVFSGQYMRLQERDNRPAELFMIVSDDKQYDTKIKAMVDECTEVLKWYDEDGNLREYPVVVKRSSGDGWDEDRYMILTDGTYVLGVPQDENTRLLQEGQGFIFNNKHKYRISRFSDIESSTFMHVTFKKFEENPDVDNFDLGIADYTIRPRFTLTTFVESTEIAPSDILQVQYTLLDKDGLESDKPVVYSSTDESIAVVDSNGLITAIANGNCIIRVSMEKNSSVFDEIALEVTNTPQVITTYIVIPDISVVYRFQSVEFTAQRLDNGQPQSETFSFNIVSSTVDESRFEFEIIDSDTFRIRNIDGVGQVSINIIPQNNPLDAFLMDYELNGGYG